MGNKLGRHYDCLGSFFKKKKLIKLFFDSKIDFPRFFYFGGSKEEGGLSGFG